MIRTAVLPFGRPGIIARRCSVWAARSVRPSPSLIILRPSSRRLGVGRSSTVATTFASKIAGAPAEFRQPAEDAGAFIAAGLVLFVLTFVVNAIARIVIERRKAFTE